MIDLRQQWVQFYQVAREELSHARVTGTIGAARDAILARLEILRELPGLHEHEREVIADSLRSLKFLEVAEEKYQKEEKQRLLDEALEKLSVVVRTIERWGDEPK